MSMSDQSALPDPRIKRVQSGNHAWLVGQMFGAAMRLAASEAEAHPDLRDHTMVDLIDFEDGSHAATFRIIRPSGSYLVTVEVEDDAG